MYRCPSQAPSATLADEFAQCGEQLIRAGARLAAAGMMPATSGNLSVGLTGGRVAITVSGCDKGRLAPEDIVLLDADGRVPGPRRPSAEAALHLQVYRRYADVRAVVHTHAVSAVALSRDAGDALEFAGYEILKALPGFATHAAKFVLPVFGNSQDVPALAATVDAWMAGNPQVPGYVIAQHGLYAFGADLDAAVRHTEAIEHLLQCELAWRGATKR